MLKESTICHTGLSRAWKAKDQTGVEYVLLILCREFSQLMSALCSAISVLKGKGTASTPLRREYCMDEGINCTAFWFYIHEHQLD